MLSDDEASQLENENFPQMEKPTATAIVTHAQNTADQIAQFSEKEQQFLSVAHDQTQTGPSLEEGPMKSHVCGDCEASVGSEHSTNATFL